MSSSPSNPDGAPTARAALQQQREITIALAQIAPRLGDVPHNLALHLETIGRARDQGADAILFPELSLTGYFLRDMVPDLAMSVDAEPLGRLVEAAGGRALVAGFVEESPAHRFYNAALFAEGGAIRHVHRKVYLPTYGLFDEKRYFATGERIRAVDSDLFGRVGLLICEDLWHLSAVTILQAEDIDILICVSNSPARGVRDAQPRTAQTYERFCRTFAELLGAVVIFVHRVGFEDGLCFWGGSMVVGPDGEMIERAPLFDESLTLAKINRADLRRRRVSSPLARDEQLLLSIEELERIKRTRYDS